jgi:putative NADH-flavin reductase
VSGDAIGAIMRVALLGATGRTGALVLQECLRRGWHVQALVRDKSKVHERDGLTCVQGDARSREAVARALAGSTAVLCCLGMHDISIAAADFSKSVRCIVDVMHDLGIRRLLAIASAGVLDRPSAGHWNKERLPANLANVSAEHVRNYDTLRGSDLDWTLMCPAYLKVDISVGHAQYLFEDLPSGSNETGYKDLATTMTALVEDADSYGRRVGIVSFR